MEDQETNTSESVLSGEDTQEKGVGYRISELKEKLNFRRAPALPEQIRDQEEKVLRLQNQDVAQKIDERTEQAILRQINNTELPIEKRRELFESLSPEAKRFTPDPRVSEYANKTKEELQKDREELMDKMWSDPNEFTQDKIKEVDKVLGEKYGVESPRSKLRRPFDEAKVTAKIAETPPVQANDNKPKELMEDKKPTLRERVSGLAKQFFSRKTIATEALPKANIDEVKLWLTDQINNNPSGLDAGLQRQAEDKFGKDTTAQALAQMRGVEEVKLARESESSKAA